MLFPEDNSQPPTELWVRANGTVSLCCLLLLAMLGDRCDLSRPEASAGNVALSPALLPPASHHSGLQPRAVLSPWGH